MMTTRSKSSERIERMRSLCRWWARVGSSGNFMRGNVARGLRAWHVLAFALSDGMENTLARWWCSHPRLCHVHPRSIVFKSAQRNTQSFTPQRPRTE
jgi:hypothetical protein